MTVKDIMEIYMIFFKEKIYIYDIEARSPDGRLLELSPMIFQLE